MVVVPVGELPELAQSDISQRHRQRLQATRPWPRCSCPLAPRRPRIAAQSAGPAATGAATAAPTAVRPGPHLAAPALPPAPATLAHALTMAALPAPRALAPRARDGASSLAPLGATARPVRATNSGTAPVHRRPAPARLRQAVRHPPVAPPGPGSPSRRSSTSAQPRGALSATTTETPAAWARTATRGQAFPTSGGAHPSSGPSPGTSPPTEQHHTGPAVLQVLRVGEP
jgi:translation initiation factor IF-2